jgi:hypothetical protein
VVVPVGDQIVKLVEGIWLRKDIVVIGRGDVPDASRIGSVYAMILERPSGDPQDSMPWVSAIEAREVFRCSVQSEPLLFLRNLGPHAKAIKELEKAHELHRSKLAGELEKLKAHCLAHPDDLKAMAALFLAAREIGGNEGAMEVFKELLPKIEDPVLREKILRWWRESGGLK